MSRVYHNTWSNRIKPTKISAFTHVYIEILSGYTWGEGQTAWIEPVIRVSKPGSRHSEKPDEWISLNLQKHNTMIDILC